jgi:glycosyltransferase involved in cell wall biosynthesis
VKVSVILPTYNRGDLIGRAIQSVLAQTYRDFELIIVDDGSTDNTEEVVRTFDDRCIRYLKYPKNRGVAAARNTGIKMAGGSYIAFQDSDDEWLPPKLEKQMALFDQDKEGNLGMVLCERLWIRGHRQVREAPRADQLNYKKLLSYLGAYVVATPQYLLKRDVTEPELYFDENLRAYEDWDFMVRISRICRLDYVKEALIKSYEQRRRHFMEAVANSVTARDALFRKYVNELRARPRALSLSYQFQAVNIGILGQMARMRNQLKTAVRAYPWNPVPYFLLAASLSGRRGFQLLLSFYLAVKSFSGSLLHRSQ